MKRKDLTTQVGKIDGTNKKYAAYRDIYDMIRGEIPGVQVRGKSILIQGPGSLNLSTEPLLVVDGVIINSIDDISPREVKSIEVLKGASASIYGSRGANGVIMIYLIGAGDFKK
jgi:TonB-dependent SusC/RagA subfamily outer membrane receptor